MGKGKRLTDLVGRLSSLVGRLYSVVPGGVERGLERVD